MGPTTQKQTERRVLTIVRFFDPAGSQYANTARLFAGPRPRNDQKQNSTLIF